MRVECPIIRATDPSYVISIPSPLLRRGAPFPAIMQAGRNFCHNSGGTGVIRGKRNVSSVRVSAVYKSSAFGGFFMTED